MGPELCHEASGVDRGSPGAKQETSALGAPALLTHGPSPLPRAWPRRSGPGMLAWSRRGGRGRALRSPTAASRRGPVGDSSAVPGSWAVRELPDGGLTSRLGEVWDPLLLGDPSVQRASGLSPDCLRALGDLSGENQCRTWALLRPPPTPGRLWAVPTAGAQLPWNPPPGPAESSGAGQVLGRQRDQAPPIRPPHHLEKGDRDAGGGGRHSRGGAAPAWGPEGSGKPPEEAVLGGGGGGAAQSISYSGPNYPPRQGRAGNAQPPLAPPLQKT